VFALDEGVLDLAKSPERRPKPGEGESQGEHQKTSCHTQLIVTRPEDRSIDQQPATQYATNDEGEAAEDLAKSLQELSVRFLVMRSQDLKARLSGCRPDQNGGRRSASTDTLEGAQMVGGGSLLATCRALRSMMRFVSTTSFDPKLKHCGELPVTQYQRPRP